MYGQSTYALREVEVRFDRLAGVVRISDDQAADDEQTVAMEVIDRFKGGVPTVRPCSRRAFFAPRFQETEVLVENVLDAEEHVAEPGPPHERRQRAPCWASGAVMAWTK